MNYAKKVNAGLVLIMTDTESEGLFSDSYSQKLVYRCATAVPSLPSQYLSSWCSSSSLSVLRFFRVFGFGAFCFFCLDRDCAEV